MLTTFDRNIFTQTGLDSAALTSLGAIVHMFGEEGEYRGVVRAHDRDSAETIFRVSVERSCAVAQVNIDLAQLVDPPDRGCCGASQVPRFVVHPKGYAVFHVASGAGGYSVNVRRAEEDPELRAYDTRRQLEEGDIFSALMFRPGRYRVRSSHTEGEAWLHVAYPSRGARPYRPPAAEVVQVGADFAPHEVRLSPLQGVNLQLNRAGRVRIELVEADDGPKRG